MVLRGISVVLGVALAASGSVATGASADEAVASGFSSEAEIAAWIEDASEILELTEEDRAFLSDHAHDPDVVAAVPVEVSGSGHSSEVVCVPMSTGSPTASAAPDPGFPPPGTYCPHGSVRGRTHYNSIAYQNRLRQTVIRLRMDKYVEYDGRRITRASNARVYPDVERFAWSFTGVTGRTNDFRTWNGRSNGAHESWASARFRSCIVTGAVSLCMQTKNPRLWITAYGNGTADKQRRY